MTEVTSERWVLLSKDKLQLGQGSTVWLHLIVWLGQDAVCLIASDCASDWESDSVSWLFAGFFYLIVCPLFYMLLLAFIWYYLILSLSVWLPGWFCLIPRSSVIIWLMLRDYFWSRLILSASLSDFLQTVCLMLPSLVWQCNIICDSIW